MKKVTISGISNTEKILLACVFDCFFNDNYAKDFKKRITEKGVKKIIQMQYGMAMDLIPSICLLDQKDFNEMVHRQFVKLTIKKNKSLLKKSELIKK